MENSARFAILATPTAGPATIFGLYEVFTSVGRAWEELTGEPNESPRLDTSIVTRDGLPVLGGFGVPIAPQSALQDADVVIVPDVVLNEKTNPESDWSEEIDWLRERHAAGAMICSVCSGTAMLAASGLLDGHEATTHWAAVDFIRSRYPKVKLVPQRVLTSAGEGHQVVTAGGAASWEELAMYLIARYAGGTEAVRMSKIFVLGDRTDGQLPFAGARRAQHHDDATIAPLQEWLAENYHHANPVARMVKMSCLPERTFLRRFQSATGYRPIDYVQTLRIEEAKQLLESTRSQIEDIAIAVGYEDSNFFRRLFKRRVGITPARYRQKFASIANGGALGS